MSAIHRPRRAAATMSAAIFLSLMVLVPTVRAGSVITVTDTHQEINNDSAGPVSLIDDVDGNAIVTEATWRRVAQPAGTATSVAVPAPPAGAVIVDVQAAISVRRATLSFARMCST
jgi:hypothetical protein